MRTSVAGVLGVAIVVVALEAGFKQSPPTETPTTICALERRHQEMNGKRVRVRALFASDHRENSVLYDPGCPSVTLELFLKQPREGSVESFNRALYDHLDPLEMNRVFSLDASGVFSWRPEGTPHGRLTIDQVWRFGRIRKK